MLTCFVSQSTESNYLGMVFGRSEKVLSIDVCVLLLACSCNGVWEFNRKGDVNSDIGNLWIAVMGY